METDFERPGPRERGNDRCCSPRAQLCAAWRARTTQTFTTARSRSAASRASKRARRRRPNRAARVFVALRGQYARAGGWSGLLGLVRARRIWVLLGCRARRFRCESQAQKRARDQQHHHHHQRRCRRTRHRRCHHHASHTRPGPHILAEYDQRALRYPYYGACRY